MHVCGGCEGKPRTPPPGGYRTLAPRCELTETPKGREGSGLTRAPSPPQWSEAMGGAPALQPLTELQFFCCSHVVSIIVELEFRCIMFLSRTVYIVDIPYEDLCQANAYLADMSPTLPTYHRGGRERFIHLADMHMPCRHTTGGEVGAIHLPRRHATYLADIPQGGRGGFSPTLPTDTYLADIPQRGRGELYVYLADIQHTLLAYHSG